MYDNVRCLNGLVVLPHNTLSRSQSLIQFSYILDSCNFITTIATTVILLAIIEIVRSIRRSKGQSRMKVRVGPFRLKIDGVFLISVHLSRRNESVKQ